MSDLASYLRGTENYLEKNLSILHDNVYLNTGLALLIAMYAGVVAPELPLYITNLLTHPISQILVFFLISFLAQKDVSVALIVAIVVFITLHYANKKENNNNIFGFARNLIKKGDVLGLMGNGKQEKKVKELEEDEEKKEDHEDCDESCPHKVSYRNHFYPQYVNMDPFAYKAKYSHDNVVEPHDE